MSLPPFEHVVLRKAPLGLVIGQVRFQVLPGFGEPSLLAKFAGSIREEYPKRSRGQRISLGVTGEGIQQNQETLWRFSTRDNSWLVALGEGSVSLESRGYSHVDEFLARFERVLGVTQTVMEVSERTRLGFRFINQIHRPDAQTLADWSKLLRPEFIGFQGSDLLDGEVDEMLVQFKVKRPDGELTMRHGMGKGGVVEPDGRPSGGGTVYVIDMDYFDATERELDVVSTIAQMRGYNEFMYRLFRWAVGDSLYEQLEPVKC